MEEERKIELTGSRTEITTTRKETKEGNDMRRNEQERSRIRNNNKSKAQLKSQQVKYRLIN